MKLFSESFFGEPLTNLFIVSGTCFIDHTQMPGRVMLCYHVTSKRTRFPQQAINMLILSESKTHKLNTYFGCSVVPLVNGLWAVVALGNVLDWEVTLSGRLAVVMLLLADVLSVIYISIYWERDNISHTYILHKASGFMIAFSIVFVLVKTSVFVRAFALFC